MKLRHTDSGYWFRDMDRNAEKTIEGLTVPHTPMPQTQIPLCKELPFCGLPLFSSRQLSTGYAKSYLTLILLFDVFRATFSGYWLSGPAPLVREEANLTFISKEKLTENDYQMKFSINGSFLYSLQIRPKPGVQLVKWNLLKEVPVQNYALGFTGYVVLVTHGLEAPPMKLDLVLSVRRNMDKNSDINYQ